MYKFNSKEQGIWFCSDPHYWHKNIVHGESKWDDRDTSTRRFNTVKEMSQHIVQQINKYVQWNDILIIPGDIAFSGKENYKNFRDQLNCQNIYVVYGNHDHHLIRDKELQDLFTFTGYYLELEIDKQQYCITHYPMQDWNNRKKGSIHIHGHTHGNYTKRKNVLDVGIDNAYNYYKEYRPFSLQEVNELAITETYKT